MWIAPFLPWIALGPGWWIAQRMGLRPAERWVVAVLLGLAVLGGAVFAVFVATPGSHDRAPLYALVLGLCALVTLGTAPQLCSLARRKTVRPVVMAWTAAWFASLFLVVPIRNLSGGTWIIDWQVHFSQSCHYLGYIGPVNYLADFPSRPPLQNLLTAAGMFASVIDKPGQTGTAFAAFQFGSASLASTAFLPCALILKRLVGPRGVARAVALLAAVFVFAPAVVAHVMFPWPKLLAAAFVVAGIHLYAQHNRTSAQRAAVVMLSLGCLVHYSAAVYGVVLWADVAWRWAMARWRRQDVRQVPLAWTIVVPILVLTPWLAWSVATFGWKATATSPSSINESRGMSTAETVDKWVYNLWHTAVPHPLIVPRKVFDDGIPDAVGVDGIGFDQPSRIGYWRDYGFGIYASTLPGTLGLTGLAGLCLLALRARRARVPYLRWALLAVMAILLGVMVVGGKSLFGVAQLTMVPLTLVGITLGVAGWTLAARTATRPWEFVSALGVLLLLDVAAGSLPHVVTSARTFTLDPSTGRVIVNDDTLSRRAAGQYQFKESLNIRTARDVVGWAGGAWKLAAAAALVSAGISAVRSVGPTPFHNPSPQGPLMTARGPLSRVAISTLRGLVLLYRVTLGPWLGGHCRYTPTCSQYALEALDKHGALKGAAMAVWRILRCHPFSRGGYDPP